MASGWFTLPLVRRAAQVVHTPEQQLLGSGTPAASAAANTVWSARQGKLWLVPSRLAVIKKLGVSLTGMPWLEAIFAEGGSGTMAKAAGLVSARPPMDQLEMLSSQAAGLTPPLVPMRLRS
jgi:hypothetical protein